MPMSRWLVIAAIVAAAGCGNSSSPNPPPPPPPPSPPRNFGGRVLEAPGADAAARVRFLASTSPSWRRYADVSLVGNCGDYWGSSVREQYQLWYPAAAAPPAPAGRPLDDDRRCQ